MSAPYRIYVENKDKVRADYRVTEAAVRHALGLAGEPALVTVRDSGDPDFHALGTAEYLIGAGFDTKRIRENGKSLRIIHCTSAGVEQYMPLDWLPNGAVLTNSSGVHAEKGGTFGAMAILMLNELVPRHATRQREHAWDAAMSTVVVGKTALIYGFGSLGEAIASKVRPFGLRILGVSRSGAPNPKADAMFRADQLHALLPEADFLVLSCPLTSETRNLIGRRELGLLRKGAGLLNLARAQVVDYAALADVLRANHLSGAILDVFDPEPLPPDAPWWDVPNLMVIPHVSCDAAEGYIDRCLGVFAANLERASRGLPLHNVVDGAKGY